MELVIIISGSLEVSMSVMYHVMVWSHWFITLVFMLLAVCTGMKAINDGVLMDVRLV